MTEADNSLQDYIREELVKCDDMEPDGVRDVIEAFEKLKRQMATWNMAETNHNRDTWWAVQGFIDDVACVLDDAIRQAKEILEDKENEGENEYSDDEYQPVRFM